MKLDKFAIMKTQGPDYKVCTTYKTLSMSKKEMITDRTASPVLKD